MLVNRTPALFERAKDKFLIQLAVSTVTTVNRRFGRLYPQIEAWPVKQAVDRRSEGLERMYLQNN